MPGARDNPPPPPDGIGPYRDLGPVQMCQAGGLLVATGPEASGFCVPSDSSAGPACESDSACASRERCLCGRCVVPYCDKATDCRAGETCVVSSSRCGVSCAADEDCAEEHSCDRGVCAARCTESGDCQRGESCSRLRSVCLANACTNEADCTSDERCDSQRIRRELREPAVLADGDGLVLYVEDREERSILRARGANRDRFELEVEPVLAEARAPAPFAVDGLLVLYYAAPDRSAILAAPAEGTSFGDASVVLEPEQAWEGGTVDAPAICEVGGRLVMAYEAMGGIGIAVEDAGVFARPGSGPAVTAEDLEDPLLWRSVERPRSPALVADRTPLGDPRLRLWVAARGAEGSATILGEETARPPLNDSIGYLESRDGEVAFTPSPFNPTFARVAELGAYEAESDPWVLPIDGSFLLYFVGATVRDGVEQGVGFAEASP
ncbi:MAG: hypothetical protein HYY06_05020 [Deltaproteobacteria bacterium]|nr:hypothetical protein [Deltaproteobacteria bacterium]